MARFTRSHAHDRASRMLLVGLLVVLASCGRQARHAEDRAAMASPSSSRPALREPAATTTYFGAEFEAQQSALRDTPIEPPVQAF